ncbi:MAG: S8 family serine peptidase [Clostridia bacterium]|nr:S8 family serine peptidase [Clostridia bacterium]
MLRKISFLMALVLILTSAMCVIVSADGIITDNDNATLIPSEEPYVENELLVLTREMLDLSGYTQGELFDFFGVPVIGIHQSFGATEEEVEQWLSVVDDCFPYKLTLHPVCTVPNAVATLDGNANVINASPNYIITADAYPDIEETGDYEIQDTGTDYTQWALDSLQINLAWGKGFVGSDDVKVAIIDLGNVAHTDLENNLDMSLAYDAHGYGVDEPVDNFHGNFVAGIIGADYNDGGINGICQNVTMIPIRTFHNVHDILYQDICEGVSYAITKGAKIINCSQKLPYDTSYLISIIESADILFVTTAGNGLEENNNVGTNMVDADDTLGKRHDSPNWIVVGSINSQKQKASHSNYSPVYCDIFAPGYQICSTMLSGYDTRNGTSYAAPHVAAACALIMSKATHLTPLEVRDLILENPETLTGFDNYCVSGGTLSINNAIEALFQENRGAYTKGDVDGDGYVDQYDYIACRRIYFGTLTPTEAQLDAADVNGDGEVDTFDVTMISRYYNRTLYFAPY